MAATLSPAAMIVRAGMMHDEGEHMLSEGAMRDLFRALDMIPGDEAAIDAAWLEIAGEPATTALAERMTKETDMNATTATATIDAPFTAAILHDAPYPGSTYGVAVDGWTFTATVYRDDDMGAPWEEHDGHGDVSEWTSRGKAPGELVLSNYRGSFRYYDFAGACATARRDGWGAPGDEGMTPRQRAAHAARADFNRLRAWCNDEWAWIGVGVTVARQGVELVPEYNHALWGIEGDSGADYLASIANELAADALSDAREKLAELVRDDEA